MDRTAGIILGTQREGAKVAMRAAAGRGCVEPMLDGSNCLLHSVATCADVLAKEPRVFGCGFDPGLEALSELLSANCVRIASSMRSGLPRYGAIVWTSPNFTQGSTDAPHDWVT